MLQFMLSLLLIFMYLAVSQYVEKVALFVRMVFQRDISPCASRLMYGGGRYTEALGQSSVGELGWEGFLRNALHNKNTHIKRSRPPTPLHVIV